MEGMLTRPAAPTRSRVPRKSHLSLRAMSSVFDRHDIVSEGELRDAAMKIDKANDGG